MTSNPFKKMMAASLLTAGILAGGAGLGEKALADTVHLKRGGSLEGKVVENDATVDVLVDEGTTTFNKTDILRIEKSPVHERGSLKAILAHVKSMSSATLTKTKQLMARTRSVIQKKTAGWFKPVGYKKDNPNSIKAISAKEKKRIS